MTKLISAGIILILVGFALTFIGSLKSVKSDVAFGGFLGPIPFGFATNPKLLYVLIAIMVILFLLKLRF